MTPSSRPDMDMATGQALTLLNAMHDFAKTQKKELEEIGTNRYKAIIESSANYMKAIIDTSGNSVANDMLVDWLNKLIDEIYDKYPNADEMCSIITNIMKLFNIAASKASQDDKALFKEGYLASIKSLSFQRKPQILIYDPYTKKRNQDSGIIPYNDE